MPVDQALPGSVQLLGGVVLGFCISQITSRFTARKVRRNHCTPIVTLHTWFANAFLSLVDHKLLSILSSIKSQSSVHQILSVESDEAHSADRLRYLPIAGVYLACQSTDIAGIRPCLSVGHAASSCAEGTRHPNAQPVSAGATPKGRAENGAAILHC